ncbi:MAG: zinc-binding dehydrogenase, partial [Bacteroidetes bacterium]|nr:zinc-binding dehydrogenase [Bacteroidota bacterium]
KEMKNEAIVLAGKTKGSTAFQRKEINFPAIKADQVLVKSEAFGLNYADVMASMGLYREAPPRPCVIGYELVGEIIEVGAELDASLVGKRILAFSRFGAYAQYVAIEKHAFTTVEEEPANLLLALCTQGVTAHYMSNYLSPVRAHDIVLIHAAAGGVGSLLIQLCKQKGATVIAKIGNENKRELVEALGADFTVNYNNEIEYDEAIKKLIGDKKLTVSFNPVAGSTFKKDMKLLRFGGRLFLFGGAELTAGKWGILSALRFLFRMGKPLPIAFMMKSQSILGVNLLKIADHYPMIISECLSECYQSFKKGTLKPQSGGDFQVENFASAFELLKSGKSTGKIGVLWKSNSN